jgi:16S rRNA (guanine527-N7)-methyltransferase
MIGEQKALFERYAAELIEWNQKFNLTAITDPEEIRHKHFEDSLLLLQVLPLSTESVIDIGTGAGFPGIPLKIARPGIKLTLLEATRKKTEFLKHLVDVLGLKDVEVIWGRAEEKARPIYDLAVARAVAKMEVLTGYCLPFVKKGGLFVAYKQDQIETEVKAAEKNIKKLGGKLKGIKKAPLGELVRSLVMIEKVAPTWRKNPL